MATTPVSIRLRAPQTVQVKLTAPRPLAIGVASTGPQGVPGSQGEQGPQGEPGAPGSGSFYTWNQAVPSAVWTITHPLGRKPSVVIIDSGGSVIEGDVTYPDTATVVASFTSAFAGTAELT